MEVITLKGKSRSKISKSALKALRREGFVPCNLYGGGKENLNFALEARILPRILNTPRSYIIDLDIDGTIYKSILHDAQFHPVSDEPLHVDFLSVSADAPITIDLPIKIVGVSPGVREGGKLISVSRKVKVVGDLDKLPDEAIVDISKLKLGQSIFASEVKVEGVKIVTPLTDIICMVRKTRVAIGVEAAAAAEELAEEGVVEGEESQEGGEEGTPAEE